MKLCRKCRETKPLEAFSKLRKAKDGLQPYCKKCCVASVKAAYLKSHDKYKATKRQYYQNLIESRASWKRKLADLLGGVCADCGYENLIALEFDHLNSDTKVAAVSQMLTTQRYTWEDCVTEALKCELVCSNCHALRTHYRKQR